MKHTVEMFYIQDAEAMEAIANSRTGANQRLVSITPAHGFSGYYYFVWEEPDGD